MRKALRQLVKGRQPLQRLRIQAQPISPKLQDALHRGLQVFLQTEGLHPPLPDPVCRAQMLQGPRRMLQTQPVPVQDRPQPPVQPFLPVLQKLQQLPDIIYGKLRSGRRRRRAKIRDKVNDGGVRFMPNGRNDGNRAVKDRLGHRLFIERPQILHGASAPSHDHHVHSEPFQRPDAVHNAGNRLVSLHHGRIENDLHIGIPSAGNVDDIPHRRSRRSRHNAKGADIGGDRLLVLRSEQAALFQTALQPFKFFIQISGSVQEDLLRVQLVFPVPLVDLHAPLHDHLHAFLQAEGKPLPITGEHHAGDGGPFILQRKIQMTGGMILAVAHLAPDADASQQEILGKHVPDIGVHLSHRINVLHLPVLTRTGPARRSQSRRIPPGRTSSQAPRPR